MTHRRRTISVFTLTLVLASFFILVTGCSYFQNSRSGPRTASVKEPMGPMPVYYDFGDVLVPKELKIVKKDSFVYLTSGLTVGVLSFKGRVERGSLIAFFENNMAKDGWSQVSAFKSPQTMLLFQKKDRWCVIDILEKMLSTKVKIWVSPTPGVSVPGLLKE
ncbi:MAG: hypothetical protein DSY90_06290 [Deltaproteobacteria bacterium]|nr:MAG: hypothetical protein DSY90_06290 [Deltaproteobacteria bacterium]